MPFTPEELAQFDSLYNSQVKDPEADTSVPKTDDQLIDEEYGYSPKGKEVGGSASIGENKQNSQIDQGASGPEIENKLPSWAITNKDRSDVVGNEFNQAANLPNIASEQAAEWMDPSYKQPKEIKSLTTPLQGVEAFGKSTVGPILYGAGEAVKNLSGQAKLECLKKTLETQGVKFEDLGDNPEDYFNKSKDVENQHNAFSNNWLDKNQTITNGSFINDMDKKINYLESAKEELNNLSSILKGTPQEAALMKGIDEDQKYIDHPWNKRTYMDLKTEDNRLRSEKELYKGIGELISPDYKTGAENIGSLGGMSGGLFLPAETPSTNKTTPEVLGQISTLNQDDLGNKMQTTGARWMQQGENTTGWAEAVKQILPIALFAVGGVGEGIGGISGTVGRALTQGMIGTMTADQMGGTLKNLDDYQKQTGEDINPYLKGGAVLMSGALNQIFMSQWGGKLAQSMQGKYLSDFAATQLMKLDPEIADYAISKFLTSAPEAPNMLKNIADAALKNGINAGLTMGGLAASTKFINELPTGKIDDWKNYGKIFATSALPMMLMGGFMGGVGAMKGFPKNIQENFDKFGYNLGTRTDDGSVVAVLGNPNMNKIVDNISQKLYGKTWESLEGDEQANVKRNVPVQIVNSDGSIGSVSMDQLNNTVRITKEDAARIKETLANGQLRLEDAEKTAWNNRYNQKANDNYNQNADKATGTVKTATDIEGNPVHVISALNDETSIVYDPIEGKKKMILNDKLTPVSEFTKDEYIQKEVANMQQAYPVDKIKDQLTEFYVNKLQAGDMIQLSGGREGRIRKIQNGRIKIAVEGQNSIDIDPKDYDQIIPPNIDEATQNQVEQQAQQQVQAQPQPVVVQYEDKNAATFTPTQNKGESLSQMMTFSEAKVAIDKLNEQIGDDFVLELKKVNTGNKMTPGWQILSKEKEVGTQGNQGSPPEGGQITTPVQENVSGVQHPVEQGAGSPADIEPREKIAKDAEEFRNTPRKNDWAEADAEMEKLKKENPEEYSRRQEERKHDELKPESNVSKNKSGIQGSIGKGQEPISTEPIKGTGEEETRTGRIFQTPEEVKLQKKLDQAEKETEMNPSKAQIEAGNYPKGKMNINGLTISIENPRGSVRTGTDPQGREWKTEMKNPYGYILGTKDRTGEHIDVFLGPDLASKNTYIIDQVDPSGEFDEYKAMIGFKYQAAAEHAYRENYSIDWVGHGATTTMTNEEFAEFVQHPRLTKKPLTYVKPSMIMGKESATVPVTTKNRVMDRIQSANEYAKNSKTRKGELKSANSILNGDEDLRNKYEITTDTDGDSFLIDKYSRKPVRRDVVKTARTEIESHPSLKEYDDPKFVEFVNTLLTDPRGKFWGVSNVGGEQATRDITKGKKSVASNKALDELKRQFDGNTIRAEKRNIPVDEWMDSMGDLNALSDISPNLIEDIEVPFKNEEEEIVPSKTFIDPKPTDNEVENITSMFNALDQFSENRPEILVHSFEDRLFKPNTSYSGGYFHGIRTAEFITDKIINSKERKDLGLSVSEYSKYLYVHEVGMHYGLRGILPEADIKQLCEKVFDYAENNDKAAFDRLKRLYPKAEKWQLGEEYLTHIAEKMHMEGELNFTKPEAKAWIQFLRNLRETIRKIFGKDIPLAYEDLKKIVHAAFNYHLTNSETTFKNEDINKTTEEDQPDLFSSVPGRDDNGLEAMGNGMAESGRSTIQNGNRLSEGGRPGIQESENTNVSPMVDNNKIEKKGILVSDQRRIKEAEANIQNLKDKIKQIARDKQAKINEIANRTQTQQSLAGFEGKKAVQQSMFDVNPDIDIENIKRILDPFEADKARVEAEIIRNHKLIEGIKRTAGDQWVLFKVEEIGTPIFHRGTEIHKIENQFSLKNEDFQDDNIYVSRGFISALKRGSIPTDDTTSEFHHYFVKDAERGFKAKKIYFKDQSLFKNESTEVFYSNTLRAIDKIQQEKATSEQWMAMLLKNGAKQSEMDWMGLPEFLKENPKLTKSDLTKFVNENKVELKEVVKEQAKVSQNDLDRINELTELRQKRRFTPEESKEFNTINDRLQIGSTDNTKFKGYVLPGGKNYKEWLLTMPSKPMTFEEYKNDSARNGVVFGSEERAKESYSEYLKEPGTDISKKENFKSSHWDEPNVVAHIRSQEFDEPDGTKSLVKEETQSDWQQKGRKEGFNSDESKAIRKKLHDEWTTVENEMIPLQKKSREGTELTQKETARLFELEKRDKELAEENKKLGLNPAPDMPFKNTEQITGLAFKRMLRYAAENGFDRICWPTGEQQAERYDLSKQVDSIHYDPLIKQLSARKGTQQVLKEQGVVPEKIADYIGKDAANKLLSSEINGAGNYELVGDDIKTQAPGMVGYYDKIEPSWIVKYIKPMGGVVGKHTLPNGVTLHSVEMTPAMLETGLGEQSMFKNEEESTLPEEKEQEVKPLPTFMQPVGRWEHPLDKVTNPMGGIQYLHPRETILNSIQPYHYKINAGLTGSTFLGNLNQAIEPTTLDKYPTLKGTQVAIYIRADFTQPGGWFDRGIRFGKPQLFIKAKSQEQASLMLSEGIKYLMQEVDNGNMSDPQPTGFEKLGFGGLNQIEKKHAGTGLYFVAHKNAGQLQYRLFKGTDPSKTILPDWDKKLPISIYDNLLKTAQDNPIAHKFLPNIIALKNSNFGQIYNNLSHFSDDSTVNEILREAGIKGWKRTEGDDTEYVVPDNSDLSIDHVQLLEPNVEYSQKDDIFVQVLNDAVNKLQDSDNINKSYGSKSFLQEYFQKAIDEAVMESKPKNTMGAGKQLSFDFVGRYNIPDQSSTEIPENHIIQGFAESLHISFAGQVIKFPRDIAQLFSLQRSPYIEKGHVVFVDKSGKIIANHSETLGIPSATSLGSKIDDTHDDNFIQIARMAKELNADVYLLHNHPSGNHLPSGEDIRATKNIAAQLTSGSEFKGHIIIDHNKFTIIYANGEFEEKEYKEPVDKLILPTPKVNDVILMTQFAKRLLTEKQLPSAIIMLNSQLKVAGYIPLLNSDITLLINEINEHVKNAGLYAAKHYAIVHDGSIKTTSLLKEQRSLSDGLIDIIDTKINQSYNSVIFQSPVQIRPVIKGYRLGEPEQRYLSEGIEKAVSIFGLTKNIRNAGFILPDGRMLNFVKDGRRLEHINIAKAFADFEAKPLEDQSHDKYDEARTYLERFIHDGAIRISAGDGMVEMNQHPTDEQLKLIGEALGDYRSRIFIDVHHDNGQTNSIEIPTAKGAEDIISEIKSKLNEPVEKKNYVSPVNAFFKNEEDPDQLMNEYLKDHMGNRRYLSIEEAIREAVQDTMLPVKKFMFDVVRAGGKITDDMDVWAKANSAASIMMSKDKELKTDFIEPFLDIAMKTAHEAGVDEQKLQEYMRAKDAIGRNKFKRIQNKDTEPKVYAGSIGNNPLTDDFAQRIINDLESKVDKKTIEKFWDQWRDLTDKNIDMNVEFGMLSISDGQKIKASWKDYVPQRGWKDDQSELFDYQNTQMGGAFNGLQKAKGRESQSADPIAQMINMAQCTIAYGVKNTYNQSMLHFVEANQLTKEGKPLLKGIVEPREVYYIKTKDEDGNESIEETYEKPKAELLKSGRAALKLFAEHKRLRPAEVAKQHEVPVMINGNKVRLVFGNEKMGSLVEVANALNKNNIQTISLAKLLDAPSKFLGRTTGWLSRSATGWNLAFQIPNLLRDLQYAWQANALFNNQGWAYAKNMGRALATIKDSFGKHFDPSTNPDHALYKLYTDNGGPTGFVNAQKISAIEKDLANVYKRYTGTNGILDKIGQSSALRWSKETFEKLSSFSEQTARFATFVTSIEKGRSVLTAIKDAKDVTSNFDTKGTLGKILGANYMFFNPSIQGADHALRMSGVGHEYDFPYTNEKGEYEEGKSNKQRNQRRKAMGVDALGWMVVGYFTAWVNSTIGNIDPVDGKPYYEKISPYVKHNNMIIPTMNEGHHVSIPIGFYFRNWYGLGAGLYEIVSGQTELGTGIGQALNGFTNAFAPVDVGGFVDRKGDFSCRPLIPGYGMGIHDLWSNEDYAQHTITREPFSQALEKVLPSSSLGKENVNPLIKGMTDFSFYVAGGNPNKHTLVNQRSELRGIQENVWKIADWNPSKVEYFLQYYTGGLGQFFNQLYKTTTHAVAAGTNIVSGKDAPFEKAGFEINDIPIFNRFYRNTYGDADMQEFNKLREENAAAKQNYSISTPAEIANYMSHPETARLYLRYKFMDNIEKHERKVSKLENKVDESNKDLITADETQENKIQLKKERADRIHNYLQMIKEADDAADNELKKHKP
jgi:preprotein translocase subunit YajC